MTSGNSQGPSQTALMIREGANLPEEQWRDARIAAVFGQLPKQIRELPKEQMFASAIQFFGTAQRYDLDPMQGEIFGWWDKKRGQMVVMVGRDGLLKVSTRDDNILGVSSDVVREGDEFLKVQDGDRVTVKHTSEPFSAGKVIGAYALIRMRDSADVFVARRKDQYEHLSWKDNWKTNPDEMLETRVISFALRKSTPLLSGVYTEGDFALAAPQTDGTPLPTPPQAVEPSQTRSEALAEELEAEIIDAEVVEDEPVDQGHTNAEPVEYEAVQESENPILQTSSDLAPGYYYEEMSRGWCRLWRVASIQEEDAGLSEFNEGLESHVILATPKSFRMPDLIEYARKEFDQYEQTQQVEIADYA